MIVHDSWWSNGRARASTIIDYHCPSWAVWLRLKWTVNPKRSVFYLTYRITTTCHGLTISNILAIYIAGLVVLPCSSISCRYGARCRFTRGYPECTCPVESECPVDVKPVCGSDGRNYPNACVMMARACLMRKDVTVAYDGICGTRILDQCIS